MKSLFIISILLTVIPIASLSPANTILAFSNTQSINALTTFPVTANGASLIAPGPDLGITNWTHNHIENPGLETWPSQYVATDWGDYRSGDRYTWFATDIVSEGTYSAAQTARSSPGQTGYSYWYQTVLSADMRNLTLDFDWYITTLSNPSGDAYFVYLRLSDGKYLYYYLAGAIGQTFTNSSSQANFLTRGPENTWNNLYRNLTADYLAVFPSTLPPGLMVTTIYYYIQCAAFTVQFLESYFDDVKLQNETITFIGGTTRNGDMETGSFNPWYSSGNSDAAYVSRSTTAYSESFSGNITALSNGNSSFGQLYQSPNVRITDQNQGSFSFWWQLDQNNIGNGDYAMWNFQFYNFTDYFRIWYFIGYGGFFPFSNSSWDYYLLSDNFNTTGLWQLLQCNIWEEKSAIYGPGDAILTTIFFSARATNPQARIELLIDDVKLSARAINSADFEDQRDPGTPIYGWDITVSNDITVTDQGYGGGKAANCSFDVYQGANLNQDLHKRPLNSTRETYLDTMWRLEDFSLGSIFFRIEFTNNHQITYILGTSDWGLLLNNSMNAFFNVTASGTLGIWQQMHRDLVHDYETAFGSLPDVEMSVITFYAESGNAPLEVLFDDLYLYDDPAPRLTNPMMPSTPPLHNDPVPLDVNAEDQDLDTVMLIYRINSGVYNFLPMAHLTGNTYRATIPGQPWDTLVEYFFQANDTWGMTTTLQNGPEHYQYTVDENISPDLTIDAPSDGATVTGTVTIEVTATDAESGMARVEFAIDGTIFHTDMSAPYSYSWDSTTITDGTHSIDITAIDNAGNEATDSVSIIVSNVVLPPPPVIPGFSLGSILLGLAVALMMIIIIRRRKP